MLIDFPPFNFPEFSPIIALAADFNKDKLCDAIESYCDYYVKQLNGLNDSHIAYVPYDPDAYDEHAGPEMQHIGWTLGHLTLHICATLEEGACFASILARGVETQPGVRFRYEGDWQGITLEQTRAKWHETRRMCLSYLNTFPDQPHMNAVRRFALEGPMAATQLNTIEAMLFSLMHTNDHRAQFERTVQAAKEAVA